MAQPGSLRDSSVSFVKRSATSFSCPTLAIHVTTSTTIARSVVLSCQPNGRQLSECTSNLRAGAPPAPFVKRPTLTNSPKVRTNVRRCALHHLRRGLHGCGELVHKDRVITIGPG